MIAVLLADETGDTTGNPVLKYNLEFTGENVRTITRFVNAEAASQGLHVGVCFKTEDK